MRTIFFKWAIPGLFFLYFRLFNTVDSFQCTINFADDWIRTANLVAGHLLITLIRSPRSRTSGIGSDRSTN